MRKLIVLTVCVLTLAMMASMGVSAPSTGGIYGVAVPNATNSFYATCIGGVIAGVAEVDPTATVVVQDAQGDSARQLEQVSTLLQQGAKALILIPIDSNSIAPAVQEAKEMGVPVVAMDTPITNRDGVISTVVSDNYSAGYAFH